MESRSFKYVIFQILAVASLFLIIGPQDTWAKKSNKPTSVKSKKIESKIKTQKQELSKLQKDLDRQRRKVKNMKLQEEGIHSTLNLMNQTIQSTQRYIYEIRKTENLIQQSIKATNEEIDSLDLEISKQRTTMGERVRSLYIKGKPELAEMIVRASQENDYQKRWIYLKRMVQHDAQLVREITELKQLRLSKKQLLEMRQEETHILKGQKAQEALELKEAEERQKIALNELRNNKTLIEKHLEEREAAQQMMKLLILKLVEQKKKAEKDAKAAELAEKRRRNAKKTYKKGDTCWPTKGKVVTKFGRHKDRYLKTFTLNLGVEIKAPEGRVVKAASAGRVLAVTPLPQYGQGVIIDHENGYFSVYGYLKNIRVKTGQDVETCQTIASVSSEGAINGPKIFFQLLKNRKSEDPMLWLKHAR